MYKYGTSTHARCTYRSVRVVQALSCHQLLANYTGLSNRHRANHHLNEITNCHVHGVLVEVTADRCGLDRHEVAVGQAQGVCGVGCAGGADGQLHHGACVVGGLVTEEHDLRKARQDRTHTVSAASHHNAGYAQDRELGHAMVYYVLV